MEVPLPSPMRFVTTCSSKQKGRQVFLEDSCAAGGVLVDGRREPPDSAFPGGAWERVVTSLRLFRGYGMTIGAD